MKSFDDYLKEDLTDFMYNRGAYPNRSPLQMQQNQIDPIETEAKDLFRDINTITIDALNNMPKKYRMGLEDIQYKVIKQERVMSGLKLDMEVEGKATAKESMHVKVLLKKLMDSIQKPLAEKNIKMVLMYNKINIEEISNEEYREMPTGLIRNFKFTTVCSAIKFIK